MARAETAGSLGEWRVATPPIDSQDKKDASGLSEAALSTREKSAGGQESATLEAQGASRQDSALPSAESSRLREAPHLKDSRVEGG